MIIDLQEDDDAFLFVSMTQPLHFGTLNRWSTFRQIEILLFLVPVTEGPPIKMNTVKFSDYAIDYLGKNYILICVFPKKEENPTSNSIFLPAYEEFAYFCDNGGVKSIPFESIPKAEPIYLHEVYRSFCFSGVPQDEY